MDNIHTLEDLEFFFILEEKQLNLEKNIEKLDTKVCSLKNKDENKNDIIYRLESRVKNLENK